MKIGLILLLVVSILQNCMDTFVYSETQKKTNSSPITPILAFLGLSTTQTSTGTTNAVGVVSTFAGSGNSDSVDSTGTAASFHSPMGIAFDTSWNLYVADSNNNKIRKITSLSEVTTFAGSGVSGSTNGVGTSATFATPSGVILDSTGSLYVTNIGAGNIRKITSSADVTAFAGSGSVIFTDGTGTSASFNSPSGITVDSSGNFFVTDCGNNRIRKITPTAEVTTFAGSGTSGSSDGTGTAASFSCPNGITIDTSGNLYVADSNNNKIRKITSLGEVTTFAGSGANISTDGTGTAASFVSPRGVAMDSSGNLYVSEAANIRKITSSGVVTTIAGSGVTGFADGTGTAASFNYPNGIVIDSSGSLYVADSGNHRIRKIVISSTTATGTGTALTSIAYTGSPFANKRNFAITTLVPTILPAGVSITSCTASPTLPNGLTLSATTCEISGTPTTNSIDTTYTITATNSGGSVNTTFTMSVGWYMEAYLKAPNAEANDNFGSVVSISGDTIAVGASGEDSSQATITNGTTASADNSTSNAGAVYVFKRTGTTWAQEAYLKPFYPDIDDGTNGSISISSDTIVVGSLNEDSSQTTISNGLYLNNNSASNAGAAYVIKRTGTTWAAESYLKASNAGNGYNFGISVAIDSDTIAVGANLESSNQTTITNGTTASVDHSATYSGAVYVFKRTGTTWAQEAYLKASNAEANDTFGFPVSISSDTIAVGAYREGSNQTTITNGTTASADNSLSLSGAVYVFKRTGTTWAQEAYLKAPNAEAGDFFARSLALDSDTIVAGVDLEDSNQTTITNGTTASTDNSTGNSGAVYVFKRTGTIWAQEAYLKASNAGVNDFFGLSVSIASDTIVVGAYEYSNQTTITNGTTASADNSAGEAGAVYVFKRTGTTWAQEAFLKAPNAETSDYFGRSVSISSDTIAVGAYGEDSNQTTITNGTTASADNSATDSGAVYVFRR